MNKIKKIPLVSSKPRTNKIANFLKLTDLKPKSDIQAVKIEPTIRFDLNLENMMPYPQISYKQLLQQNSSSNVIFR
jgi:hypothetical protein